MPSAAAPPVVIKPRPRMLAIAGAVPVVALALLPSILVSDNEDVLPHPALSVLALVLYVVVLIALPAWAVVVLVRRRIEVHPDRIVVTAGKRTAFVMPRADLEELRPWRKVNEGTRLDVVGPDTTGRRRVLRVTSGFYGEVRPTLSALHADVERRPELVRKEEDRQLLHDILEGIEQHPREPRMPGT